LPIRPSHLRRAARVLALAGSACLGLAGPALADSTTSGNWAGYSAHRTGVHFSSVSARWRVPAGACSNGPTFSSIWVGLGGYSKSSNALEQTGTELDCTRDGQAVYSAWYELVPAAAHDISLEVNPGDLMQAAVSVAGHRVSIRLADLTDHQTFRQTLYAAQLDTTSADWIVEAPSACDNNSDCFTLPLADFGTATVSSGRAVTRSGRAGTIVSRWWGTTTITLRPHNTRVFAGTAASAGAAAIPSTLSAGGSLFSVSYQSSTAGSAPSGPFFSSREGARHLVHPKR
jgi:Peptidase A4 family